MKSNNADEEDMMLKTVLEQKFMEMNVAHKNDAPTELKQEVFNTLNSMILLTDLADLFTVKFAQTELNFLDPSLKKDWGDEND